MMVKMGDKTMGVVIIILIWFKGLLLNQLTGLFWVWSKLSQPMNQPIMLFSHLSMIYPPQFIKHSTKFPPLLQITSLVLINRTTCPQRPLNQQNIQIFSPFRLLPLNQPQPKWLVGYLLRNLQYLARSPPTPVHLQEMPQTNQVQPNNVPKLPFRRSGIR